MVHDSCHAVPTLNPASLRDNSVCDIVIRVTNRVRDIWPFPDDDAGSCPQPSRGECTANIFFDLETK